MPARLTPGTRVGDRYRLERELGTGVADHGGVTWEALDERLDRPVALRLFDPSLDRKTIVKRAGIAASLTHPRVVRVFDTGEDGGRFFTVSELVRESLQTVRIPLAPDTALQTATDIAEALHYAHERGVVHGHLHEGNVLLSESGAKVGDFALGGQSEHAEKDDDLRSLGALMGRVTRTSDSAGTVGFTRVIDALASGAYTSAAEALNDLRALQPTPQEGRPRGAPRRGWLVIAVAVLLGLAAFGVMQLGDRQPKQELVPGGRIEGTPLTIAGVDDLDPQGDNAESPGTVRNAIDGDSMTFWSTERYQKSADFNGSKDGVGLIFDLGKTTAVGKAQILWVASGCSFQLRYSANPQAPVGEWAQAATLAKSPASAALEFEAAEARYWMLWITRLTKTGDRFQCGVKDADLFAPD